MHSKATFREIVEEKFNYVIKKNYLPDQSYINRLIAALNNVEANSYDKSHTGFISEYKYLEKLGVLKSIKEFVDGCLYQLLWINTILESGNLAGTEDKLEEDFDYETPTLPGDPWILDKVTKKGVYFRGDDMYQDSKVLINSDNIIEIALALSTVTEKYNEFKSVDKNLPAKSTATYSTKAKKSSLFIRNNRNWVKEKYNINVRYPKRYLVVGRRWDFSNDVWKEIIDDYKDIEIITFDELIDGVVSQFYM